MKGMSAAPGEVEWHCPYCDITEPTLRDVQEHITESVDGDHEGVSGDNPGQDIVARDPATGNQVDKYESTNVVRPTDTPMQGTSKRKQIVAAWIANNRNEDPDAIAAVTDADSDYAQQVLGQIRRGEITNDYWEDIDQELIDTLENQLEDRDTDDTAETMSTQQQTLDADDVDDATDAVTAKEIVINTYDLVGEDVNRKQAWQALSSSNVFDSGYEYFRRTYKEIIDGLISEEEIEEAVDDQIQSVIEPVLFNAGVIGSAETQSPSQSSGVDDASFGDFSTEVPSASASEGASRENGGSGVSVEDIEEVREKVALLREQAEYEGKGEDSAAARRAEFFGKKVEEWLVELIDDSQ